MSRYSRTAIMPSGSAKGKTECETGRSVLYPPPLVTHSPDHLPLHTLASWRFPKLGLGLALLLLVGCASIGPTTVTRDRFDYTGAVAESWKRQMLLNMVKIRYGDTPVFLDIGQIVSGYTMQSTFTAAGNIFNTNGPVPGVPNSSIGLGAQGQFTDRPTITYAPLVGERFARAFMAPVPPAAILSLIQAGNPADIVLRLGVNVVNGIRNRFGGDVRARPADPEFYVLLERLRRIQRSGAVAMRVRRVEREEPAVFLIFSHKMDPGIAEDVQAVRQMLSLDPSARNTEWCTPP